MQTKPKTNSIVTTQREGDDIIFAVRGAGETRLTLTKMSEAIRTRAMIHGIVQRVSDAAAKSRDATTGLPVAPEVKLMSMARLVDHYNSGSEDWSPARPESAPRGPNLDRLTLLAIMEVLRKDEGVIRSLVEAGATKHGITQPEYLAKLGTGAKVAAVVERMRGEIAPEMDADAELDGLMG